MQKKVSSKEVFLKNLGFVSSVMGGISLLSLVNSGFSVGWTKPLYLMLEQYFVITNSFRAAFEPVFTYFGELLDIDLTVSENWPDLFLLIIIYLGSRIKSYFSSQKHARGFVMTLTAILIALFFSFYASSIQFSSPRQVVLGACMPLIAFLVYDILYAGVGATLDRGRNSWLSEFFRHLVFSVPLLLWLFCLKLVLMAYMLRVFQPTFEQSFVILLSVDYLVISLYWLYSSLRFASNKNHRNLGETVKERFWRSSATNVAINVGIVFFSALGFMLFNSGLKTAGVSILYLNP